MVDILCDLNQKPYIKNPDEAYEIRFCKIEEVDELQEFINLIWREKHILSQSKELLD